MIGDIGMLGLYRSNYIYTSHLHVLYEPVHEISKNVVCATRKASDQPAHLRSLISLCLSLEYSMIV